MTSSPLATILFYENFTTAPQTKTIFYLSILLDFTGNQFRAFLFYTLVHYEWNFLLSNMGITRLSSPSGLLALLAWAFLVSGTAVTKPEASSQAVAELRDVSQPTAFPLPESNLAARSDPMGNKTG